MAQVTRTFSAADRLGMYILLHALDAPANAFLIGAGVSSERVAIGRELKKAIATEWLNVGAYDAEVPPHGPLFSNLGLDRLFEPHELAHGLIRRIYDSSIRSLLYVSFSKAQHSSLPSAYRIFLRLPSPLDIYNMNVDGLASRIAYRGISVANLHGTVAADINWVSRENAELAKELIELGIDLPGDSRIWYPEREPTWITKMASYQRAKQRLKRARCLFVLGYSFGRHDSTLDDAETFGFFCEMVRTYGTPIVVLNLDPTPLVDLLNAAIGTGSIVGIALDWNRFARALLSLPRAQRWPLLPLAQLQDELLVRYRELLDQTELDSPGAASPKNQ